MEEWIKKMWCIYIQWNITQPQKEQNNAISSDMDGPRDCHMGKESKKEWIYVYV